MENNTLQEEFNILQQTIDEEIGKVHYSNEEIRKNVNGQMQNIQMKNIIKKDISVDTEDEISNNIKSQYIYRNFEGTPLYRIVEQKVGKKYVVQRFQNNQYEFGLEEVKKVPYNVQKLNNCEGRVVFVVNGEDKADLLTSLGFIATTAPFVGNKKWKEEYNTYLNKAKAVIVMQDNKSNNTKYICNTYSTLKKSIDNVGLVHILDLAIILNISIPDESTLIDLANQLNNKELLKKTLIELEELM